MAAAGRDGHVQLTDLGFAKHLDAAGGMHRAFTLCGTPDYMAPEIISRKGHGAAADLWSAGIVLYEMCSGDGKTPFHSDIPAVTYRKVLRGRMSMPAHLRGSSTEALISALLQPDPVARLGCGVAGQGIADVMAHAFFTGQGGWDWPAMAGRAAVPPWLPSQGREMGAEDYSHFSGAKIEDDEDDEDYGAISEEDARLFDDL